jgi:hypothetical protein
MDEHIETAKRWDEHIKVDKDVHILMSFDPVVKRGRPKPPDGYKLEFSNLTSLTVWD